MRTAVVILNWNTRGYLERWLPALVASCSAMGEAPAGAADNTIPADPAGAADNAGPAAGVVVADNASTDGSAAFVRGAFPEVAVMEFDTNYGFTGGYNRAIEDLSRQPDAPEYVVLINSDVQVEDGWLQPLVAWMDSHPECGVCGPKILSLDNPGMFEYAGAAGGYVDRFGYPFCRGRVPGRTESDFGQYDSPRNVLWVSGACMMVRMSLWKRMGGLDDRFFAHQEEIDFCWRTNLAGMKVTVVPASKVLHLGGGTLPQESPFKLKLNYRNNLLLLDNNLAATVGNRKAGAIIFFRMVLDGASAMVYLVTGRAKCFRAVIDAHNEYRELRHAAVRSGDSGQQIRPVEGYMKLNILWQTAIRGKRIFKFLKRYEDSH